MSNKKEKKIKKFDKLLNKLLNKKEVVQIERVHDDEESNINGILLNRSADFIHLVETEEFNFIGQVILPIDSFASLRCNEYDKTYKKILKKEGMLTKYEPSKTNVSLDSWAAIFSGLQDKGIHVIVECEDLFEPSFTIGPIQKVTKKAVHVRYYDATGQLDKKATKVKFEDITLLKFEDRYTKVFSKYLKDPK